MNYEIDKYRKNVFILIIIWDWNPNFAGEPAWRELRDYFSGNLAKITRLTKFTNSINRVRLLASLVIWIPS